MVELLGLADPIMPRRIQDVCTTLVSTSEELEFGQVKTCKQVCCYWITIHYKLTASKHAYTSNAILYTAGYYILSTEFRRRGNGFQSNILCKTCLPTLSEDTILSNFAFLPIFFFIKKVISFFLKFKKLFEIFIDTDREFELSRPWYVIRC